jgi:SAM-dependent methyltransferase
MYDELASVYEFLVPDVLLEPEGAAAEFAAVVEQLEPGARVLDCAAGTGQLAVGLALRGFDVAATDASEAMIARTRALAEARGVALAAEARSWNGLADRGWSERFDAVLCVGNSLTHAGGRAERRKALAAMAGVLRAGGLLVVTSRNWERLRAGRSRLEIGERLVERDGRRAVVVRHWWLPDGWEEPHGLEVAVALLGDDGSVTTHRELLAFWPFTEAELREDLAGAGLEPDSGTYEPDAERYLVSARAPAGAGAGGGSPRPAC